MHMKDLYGEAENMGLIYSYMVLGSLAAEGIILLSVYVSIRRTDKMTAVEALYGKDSRAKKNLWLPATIITAAALFMILVPWNLRSTLNAPEFVTYMGIGESQIRIDVRQTDNVEDKAAVMAEEVGHDSRVAAICERILYMLDGEIRGELKLGKHEEGDSRAREQKTARWLENMGW